MFELKPIVRQVLLACSGVASAALLIGPDAAVAQQKDQIKERERVTITGSNIRRTDTETVAPVEIITREQIERSGRTSVADVLKNLPAQTGGVFNEHANSFAPGASSVSLRGLGQKATLVLINGRRTAGYGFAQNIQDSFVDLNSIPTSAVERIEILKDGASAIYGSDAIAGVVNVILRRDFKGVEVAAGTSFYENSKNEYRASLTAGFGDLGSQKFNVFGVLDYFKRDGVQMSETEFGQSRDFRGQQGGRNFQSLTGGGTWAGLAGTPTANVRRAHAECPNVVDYNGAVARGLLPINQSSFAPGTGNNLPGNTWCARDFSNVFQLYPESERVGFLGRGTFDFTPTVQAYTEVGLSRSETFFKFQEPFFAGTSRIYQIPGGGGALATSPFNAFFAPGSAGNPLGFTAQYLGVLNDFGTRDTDIKADGQRLLVGVRYPLASWELDSAVGYSVSDITQTSKSLLTAGTIAALNIPTTIQPPTPTSNASFYNLNNPSLNSAALRASMFGSTDRTAESKLLMVDTKATTELGSLPGGPIGFAVGGEFRDESIVSPASQLAATGGILGQGSTSVNGTRYAAALYTELALPLTQTVEMQAALRNDAYNDFGSAITPKLGVKWKPASEFLIRANWGRGFKAPSLPEITPSSAFFFTVITEPTTGAPSQIAGSINANPNLKPEKSRNTTLGFVFEPSQNFNVSVDWYEIKWTDQVVFEDFQAIADNPADPRAFRDPTTGVVLSIAGQYINAAKIFTRGTDFDVRYTLRTTIGRFNSRFSASYLDTYEFDLGDGQGVTEAAGGNIGGNALNVISLPRWKFTFTQDWDQGPWTVTGRVNYTHHYRRDLGTDNFYGFVPPGVPGQPSTVGTIPQTGFLKRTAPSFTTYDLFLRYAVTANLSVSGAVINVADSMPPFEPGLSTTYFYDRTQYDARGRYYTVGVRYKFL